MSSLTLWTIQTPAVAAQLQRQVVYYADWAYTPNRWRPPYEWMAAQLQQVTQMPVDAPPVWCWHSCNGVHQQPPSAGTILALDSRYAQEPGFVVQLQVPTQMVLLSSYYGWNRFLDRWWQHQSIPRSRRRTTWLFQPPLLKHSDDDVQAVIPWIQPEWIQRLVAFEPLSWTDPLPL